MLERLAFDAPLSEPSTMSLIEQMLKAHGIPQSISAPETLSWLQDVTQAVLPIHPAAPALRLCDVQPGRQQREWEFHLPLSGTSAQALQAALAHMGVNSVTTTDVTATLPVGFFTGFVDLVFEHEGRYYVVDYKSNHLGDRDEDYAQASLDKAVQSHHYDAQAALYLLALHRYLQAVLPGYSPQQHIGGVCLLFLRGMFASKPEGVWVLPWTVEGLDELNRVIS
jgi:exodeoxyribonuclease V beta subunit